MKKYIYEIYRACRLCGVGAGYKMPIIQSIIHFDDEEIELKQKIKECVQIEVNLSDRMPPLICELCVDKIHDYYEFRKMCQETNKKTRLRLGLPLQTVHRNPKEDSVLVVEDLISDSDEGEPLSTQLRRSGPKSKVKPELGHQIKFEHPIEDPRSSSIERRETRNKRAPSPKRVTRQNRSDDMVFTELQEEDMMRASPRAKPGPKSMKKDGERQKEPAKEMDYEIENNSLLVPSQKRPRDVFIETAPAVKRIKLETPKPDKTSKPGPKSSKEPAKSTPSQKPTPKAGPKSKRAETSPAIRVQKPEPMPTPPKSKVRTDQETKAKKSEPAAKSKSEVAKAKSKEASPKPGPKSKKVETFAVPKSKSRDALAKTAEVTPTRPPKAATNTCNICGVTTRTSNGLAQHMKVHVPYITSPKLACNACELWFVNPESTSAHHRQHTSMGYPYTCAKCYDDFRTVADYELHFARNQCLATYEVPDVKCDECWRMFATYKLLEEHRCAGEGGRPGGKCPKCKRSFATQKSLVTHEMRCTVKKKVEPEPEVDDSARGMLPMRVRIVRCDALLSAQDGRYDVTALSTIFGLDRNSRYPYLPRINIKPALGPMVAIRDEIKTEYLNEGDKTDDDKMNCDSDDDSDAMSKKSVDSLSTISLKTIFLPNRLGEATSRNIKSEKGSDSPSIDIRSGIGRVIDDLAKESNNSDNDSDSILDKNVERNCDSVDIFDGVKNIFDANSNDSREMNKSEPYRTDTDRMCGEDDDSVTNVNRVENDTNDQITGSSQNKNNDLQVQDKLEVTNSDQEALDVISTEQSQKCSEDSKITNDLRTDDISDYNNDSCKNSPKNGRVVNKENESLSIESKDENTSRQTELENLEIDKINPEINSENVSNLVDSSEIKMDEIKTQKRQVLNTSEETIRHVDINTNKTLVNIDELNVTSCGDLLKDVSSRQPNDSNDLSPELNHKVNETENVVSNTYENDDSEYNLAKTELTTDEFKSKETENVVSNAGENYSEHSLAETESTTDEVKSKETTEPYLENSNEYSTTENELIENKNIKSVDKFNVDDLDDEDKLFMAELDAQIGEDQTEDKTSETNLGERSVVSENNQMADENSYMIGENSGVVGENSDMISGCGDFKSDCPVGITNEGFSEKKMDAIDVLMNKQNDLKSLELDNVSDEEFNFDL